MVNAESVAELAGAMDAAHGVSSISSQRPDRTTWGPVLDQLFTFVGITDLEGVLLEANEAPLKAAGIAADEVIGKPFWDAYWWSYCPQVQAQLKEAVKRAAGGDTVRYDAIIRVVNDGRATIDFQVAPLRDATGRITHLVPSAVDITERVRTEAARAEADRRFVATFEQAAVGIAHVGIDGRFLRVNRRYSEITGFSREELLSGGFQKITHPEDLDADLAHVGRLLAGEADSYSMEKRYIRSDGSIVWVNLTGSLIRDAAGQPDFFVAVVEDITDRVNAQQALAARKAQLNTIIETVPVGLLMAEFPSGRIVGSNKYVEQMVRHPVLYSQDLHSYGEWSSYHANGMRVSSHEYPFARMMLAGEENPSLEVHYERGDGTRAWTLITGRPVRNEAGELTGGVVALVDVDEERRAKLALEEALMAKEVLLYEVNHRVKNSLQLVNALLLIEASKIADPQARGAVINAREKIATISKLHQRLYADGGHDTVDFVAFLNDLVTSLTLSADQRERVKAEVVDCGSEPLPIRLAAPLAMAANELVTNALKYAFPDRSGRIGVQFATTPDEATLLVADDGIGLAEGFDPGKSPTTGMQVVTGLVRQIGGRLDVESGAGGTIFRIVAPIGGAQ